MKSLRKTKIVGTIGPASENRLEELFDAGLNVTRINYSHGSWEEQKDKTETILKLREEKDIPIALLLDMKGPEIRTGMLYTGKNTKIQLKDGQKFTLVNEDIVGNEEKGISPIVVKNSDFNIIIKMYGTMQSLNVSVATGILLFEARKQLEKKCK